MKIKPSGFSDCTHPTGRHSWYRWTPTNGDTYEPGVTYRYEARCQMMGCLAIRYCNHLEIADKEYAEKDRDGNDFPISLDAHGCDSCEDEATWVRRTQFSGDHYFCTPHAEKQSDFGSENPSYFFWKEL